MPSCMEDRAGYTGLALAPAAPDAAAADPEAGLVLLARGRGDAGGGPPTPQHRRSRLLLASLPLAGLLVALGLLAARGGRVRGAGIEVSSLLRADDEHPADEQGPTSSSSSSSSSSSTAAPAPEDAEHKLEMGAAAFTAHWFGEDDTTMTTPRPAVGASGDPTQGWYRVYIKTIVRRDIALDSPQVAVVPAGVFVHAAERRGRRIRVDRAGTNLAAPRRVAGWLSTETADGTITILRPIDPEELPTGGPDGRDDGGSLAKLLARRKKEMLRKQKYDEQAQKVAKMTVYQRAITQDLQKVNPNKTAHSIAYFSQHREEVEEKGVKVAERAGEHALDSLEKGANVVLGKVDSVVSDLTGDDHKNDGAPVKPISIGVKGDTVKSVFGFLKKELG